MNTLYLKKIHITQEVKLQIIESQKWKHIAQNSRYKPTEKITKN